MPIAEALVVSLAIEDGSRGYDWAKQTFGENDAPIRAARIVAERYEEGELNVADFKAVFGQVFAEGELDTLRSADRGTVVARLTEGFDEHAESEIGVESMVVVKEYVDRLERELARELTDGLDMVINYAQTLEAVQQDVLVRLQQLQSEFKPDVREVT